MKISKFIAPTILLGVILYFISLANKYGTIEVIKYFAFTPHYDKVAHFVLYGALTYFLDQAIERKRIRLFGKRFSLAVVLVLSFCIVEEMSQLWIVTRSFEVLDLVGDVAGVLFFRQLSLMYWMKPRRFLFSFYKPTKKILLGLKVG